jgi:glycerol uptake facilitator-like aquaporin
VSRYVGEFLGTFALVLPGRGASMNPVRSLAPALVSGKLSLIWVYLIAPFIGSALAIVSCRLMRTADCCTILDPEEDGCPDRMWGDVSAKL